MPRFLTTLLVLLSFSSPLSAQTAEPHRLEVLFLGDDRGHKPLERFRVLKQALGPKGYNLSFIEDLSALTRETLERHDALIVYANHEQDTLPNTIIPWVRDGGGLVALHSACGCFHPSKEWFALVGGRFKSHEGHVFSPRTVDLDHPITKDLPALKCWDETYVHRDLAKDLHLLQVRDPINNNETAPEPWTWTRNEGRGRVFYTASGHDLRCWNEPAYQLLVERGILWAIGETRTASFRALVLPPLEIEAPEIPDRAHPEIPMMPLQKPLSAADSAKHTQVPAGTKLVLFAAEPMVVNPIAIDWDQRGRAWVVESFGYPNDVPAELGRGQDRIKILEDRDGDGAADKMTVFAEGLRHCTTTTFVRGGVLATDGEDIVFLRDDDGDDRADTRTVLASGLKIWDTHASTSHFLYSMDNWIHATVGYSGIDMKLADGHHKFGAGVFRFRSDLSALEHLQRTTNNTWGLGFTEDGEILGSTANNNPSWMLSIPAAAYAGSGIEQAKTPRIDKQPLLYPNTFDITQVDQINRFTAGAGHMLYNDRFLDGIIPRGSALICAPTGHLVAIGKISDHGSLKSTTLRGTNLFASADAWSAPVAARPGPDGAVWIADWYNPIVQHNVVFRFWNPARGYDQLHSPYHSGKPKPGKGNAYVTPLRDRKHGRIWRIVPTSSPLREMPALDPASLVASLNSSSQHLRLQAQRLLVEHGGGDVIPTLTALIEAKATPESSTQPLGSYHALRTLQGLATATAQPPIIAALDSPHSGIRLQAMLSLDPGNPQLLTKLPSLIESATRQSELRRIFISAALAPPNNTLAAAIWNRVRSDFETDVTLRQAAALAMRRQGSAMLGIAFATDPLPKGWPTKQLDAIASRLAASPNRPALTALLKSASPPIRKRFGKILKQTPASPKPSAKLPAALVPGRDAYMKSCVECHQADGKGVADTFPPLLDSPWVKSDPETMLRIILGGLMGPIKINELTFNSAMPGHSHASDEELALIASFVRHTFGGLAEKPITPAQIKSLRPQIEARHFTPWTVPQLQKARR